MQPTIDRVKLYTKLGEIEIENIRWLHCDAICLYNNYIHSVIYLYLFIIFLYLHSTNYIEMRNETSSDNTLIIAIKIQADRNNYNEVIAISVLELFKK